MKRNLKWRAFIFSLGILALITSCIHEYPYGIPDSKPGTGENPNAVDPFIEVTFDLSWDSLIHSVDFRSRGRLDSPHRFVVEVTKDGATVIHDEFFITDEDFAGGKLTRNLSGKLNAEKYKIAAWYDKQSADGSFPFVAEDLQTVVLSDYSTSPADSLQCAFASGSLDLTAYENSPQPSKSLITLEMKHPGARFKIIATDIQQFIYQNKAALDQNEKFDLHFYLTEGAYTRFNAFSGLPDFNGGMIEFSSPLTFPYIIHDELTLIDGFFFCSEETEISAWLRLTNSALAPVTQTDIFTFPAKQGYVTFVYGDFLTNPIDGIFSINNIWEGEITIEI